MHTKIVIKGIACLKGSAAGEALESGERMSGTVPDSVGAAANGRFVRWRG
jgi:hypothetical protein